MCQVRQASAQGGDLAEDFGVGTKHELGLAVLQDERPIFQRLRLVHGDEGRAQAEGGVRCGGPLHPIAGDQRHAVALANAERGEPAAQGIYLELELRVRDPVPGPALLGAKQFARTMPLSALLPEFDQGLEVRVHRAVPWIMPGLCLAVTATPRKLAISAAR